MLAFEISMDRQNDSPLAGGKGISVGYFTGLIEKYAAAGTDATSLFGNGIYRAINYRENHSHV